MYTSRKNPTNVIETENTYQVKVLVPGYDKEDLSITVENGYLYLKGDVDEDLQTYTHKEWTKSPVSQKWRLPDSIDQEFLKATLEEGVLTLELTKKPELATKTIKIK